MKKSLLILAAATAVGFAACTGGNNEGTLTPAQLDSIKQVTADSIMNAQKLQSDSIANAQNAQAVDSLKRINDSLSVVAGKPVVAPTKKPTKPSKGNGGTTKPPVVEPTPEPTKTKQQSKFDQRNNTGDKTISEEKKVEQKSKFDRRNN
jgi:hypothetical protein